MIVKITLDELQKLIDRDSETVEFFKSKYLQRKICPVCGKKFVRTRTDQIYDTRECSVKAFQINNAERAREIKREWARKERAKGRKI